MWLSCAEPNLFRTPLDYVFYTSILSNIFSLLGAAGVLHQQRELVMAFFTYNTVCYCICLHSVCLTLMGSVFVGPLSAETCISSLSANTQPEACSLQIKLVRKKRAVMHEASSLTDTHKHGIMHSLPVATCFYSYALCTCPPVDCLYLDSITSRQVDTCTPCCLISVIFV
jgi:hypothetical protein